MEEVCKHCGAGIKHVTVCPTCHRADGYADGVQFTCGSIVDDDNDEFRSVQCCLKELSDLRTKLTDLRTTLSEADALLVRCYRWTEGDAQVLVPVQKLRLDIEAWGRKMKEVEGG